MKQGFLFVSTVALLAGLGTPLAYAGFEYVPAPAAQQAENPSMTPPPISPAPPATQVPLEPVSTQPLMAAPSQASAAPVTPPPAHILTLPPQAPVKPVAPQAPVMIPAAPVRPAAAPAPAPVAIPVASSPAPAPVARPLSAPPVPQRAPMPAAIKESPVNNAKAQASVDTGKPAMEKQTPAPVTPATVTAAPDHAEGIKWNQQARAATSVQPSSAPPAAAPAPAPAPGKLVINPYPQQEAMPEAPAATAQTPATAYSKVVGFGSDMPLALALQQIAPPDYTFSFGDNVNPGVRVSWEGNNRAWIDVIDDMIAPLGLTAEVHEKIVHIKNASMPATTDEGEQHGDAKDAMIKFHLSKEKMKRDNIRDPGEAATSQPPSTMESLEEAAVENQAAEERPTVPPAMLIPASVSASDAAPQADVLPLLPSDKADDEKQLSWQAHQGDSLKETLGAWSRQANVDLVWDATHDYTVDADITVNDTFSKAVDVVVAQGVKTDAKPSIKLEASAGKPKLVIADKS